MLLDRLGKELNVSFAINVNGKNYGLEGCLAVWSARRNITAHFGAFDLANVEQQKERKSFEIASRARREIELVGNDFYLGQLREAARTIVMHLLRTGTA